MFDSADDIDDPESAAYIDLRTIVVDTPSADVIITTRSQSAQGMAEELEAIQVAELTPAGARDLFLLRSKLPSPFWDLCQEVDAIADELEFFALAINLAGAYVTETPRLRSTLVAIWTNTSGVERHSSIATRKLVTCSCLLAFLSPDDLFLELIQADDESIIDGHADWLLMETSSAPVQEVLDTSWARAKHLMMPFGFHRIWPPIERKANWPS